MHKYDLRGRMPAISPFLMVLLLCVALSLSACSGQHIDPASDARVSLIEQDRQNLAAGFQAGQPYEISLDSAIDLALERNLDLRLSALESLAAQQNIDVAELETLPSVQATSRYTGRDNAGASSSRSIDTGTQSLVPSVSTEQHRRIYEVESKLNLLDMTAAIMRAKTSRTRAKIEAQQTQKMMQDITRDVALAYHKAYIAQTHLHHLPSLRNDGMGMARNIQAAATQKLISLQDSASRQAQLSGRLERLSAKEQELALAADELKTLLNIPLSAELKLQKEKRLESLSGYPSSQIPLQNLETLALLKRPEIAEQILNQNIAVRDARITVLETFPGVEFILTAHKDSNKFLDDNRWRSMTVNLVQSITRLLTLPSRLDAAEARIAMEEQKRISLVAAVLAQVNISRTTLDYAQRNYKIAWRASQSAAQAAQLVRARYKEGESSQEQAINARLEAALLNVDQDMARLGMQRSYANLLNALGLAVDGQWLEPKYFKDNIKAALKVTQDAFAKQGGDS